MGVISKGIPRGCQGNFNPACSGYSLSVFNKNSTVTLKTTFRTLSAVKSLASAGWGKKIAGVSQPKQNRNLLARGELVCENFG